LISDMFMGIVLLIQTRKIGIPTLLKGHLIFESCHFLNSLPFLPFEPSRQDRYNCRSIDRRLWVRHYYQTHDKVADI
jgi:hypothetical protein